MTDFSFLLNIKENFLSDLGMPVGTGSTKVIKGDIEPLINLSMNCVVKVADLPRSLFLLNSLDFSGSSIFVSSTDIQNVVSLESQESCIDIGGKDTADDIS